MSTATVGLISGFIGVIGTLIGVLFTQWRADIRERARLASEERREEGRNARDTERERDARLFDHRRTVYVSVAEQYHHWSTVGSKVERGELPEPHEDAMNDLWRLVSEVDLYGGHAVSEAAFELWWALVVCVYPGSASSEDPGWDALDRYKEFMAAARDELGVPSRPQRPKLQGLTTKKPTPEPEDATGKEPDAR